MADDAKNDRTHKVQVGGKIRITGLKLAGVDYHIDTKVPVAVKKTVQVQVLILRKVIGGDLAIDRLNPEIVPSRDKDKDAKASVEVDLKVAAERFAQTGIRLTWTIEIKDPPSNINLKDGLSDNLLSDKPTLEAGTAIGVSQHILTASSPPAAARRRIWLTLAGLRRASCSFGQPNEGEAGLAAEGLGDGHLARIVAGEVDRVL